MVGGSLLREGSSSNKEAAELLVRANRLLDQASSIKLSGIDKFISTIKAERKFIEKLLSSESVSQSQVRCSNLIYLEGVAKYISIRGDAVTGLFKSFQYNVGDELKKIRIDVVDNNGLNWCKIRAGKINESVNDMDYDDEDDEVGSGDDTSDVVRVAGDSKGSREPAFRILRQARELLIAASQNPLHFQIPRVTFMLLREAEIDSRITDGLNELGACIDFFPDQSPSCDGVPLTPTLNLDVTTLIALVSDITNDFASVPTASFDIEPLRHQAQQERNSPLLRGLIPVLARAEHLVVVSTAVQKFFDIVSVVGGPRECGRARALFANPPPSMFADFALPLVMTGLEPVLGKVEVVPDDPSPRYWQLEKKMLNPIHIAVFGTGETLKVTCVTANSHIQRSLQERGLGSNVFLHETRSLIENRTKSNQK